MLKQLATMHWHMKLFITMLLLLSGVAMGLVLISTPNGVGMSPDSINYISAAKTYQAGYGFLVFRGTVYILWTPAYPLTLIFLDGLANITGYNLLDMVRMHNALLFGLLVFISGFLFRQYVKSYLFAFIGTLFVLLGSQHLLVYSFVWSESLFLILLVVFFYYTAKLPAATTWLAVVPLAVVTALLPLQRYPGVLCIGIGSISILYLMHAVPLAKRFLLAVVFGITTSIPIGLWLIRNYTLTETLLGTRRNNPNPPLPHLNYGYTLITEWFTTNPLNIGYLDLSVIMIAAIILLLGYIYWRYGKITPDLLGRVIAVPLSTLTLLLFIALYMLLTVIMGARGSIYIMENRVLSPLYIPLICLILMAVERVSQISSKQVQPPWLVQGIAAVILVLVLMYPAYQGLENVAYRVVTCCQPPWTESGIIVWLNAQDLEGRFYSNTYGPMVATQIIAFPVPDTVEQLQATLSDSETATYLIWFHDFERYACTHQGYCINTEYTFDVLVSSFEVEPLFEADEGGVYRISLP